MYKYHPDMQILIYFLICHPVEYDSRIADQDKLSTFTSLDDYDTLFEARHGRGAIDSVPISDERVPAISPVALPISTTNMGITKYIMTGARPKHTSDHECPPPSLRDPISVGKGYQSLMEHRVVSPVGVGHIIGEGTAIFTDMTENMLTALDKQMALSDTAQKPEGSSLSKFPTPGQISSHDDIRSRECRAMLMSTTWEEDKYPDLYSAGMLIACQQIITQ